VALLTFLHSDSGGSFEFGLTGLASRNTPQDEAVPFGTRVVFNNSPKLRISQATALVWVGIYACKNPEAVVPFMVFTQTKLAQCDPHDFFAGLAVSNLNNFR